MTLRFARTAACATLVACTAPRSPMASRDRAAVAAPDAAPVVRRRKVLLIGLDGVRFDVLEELPHPGLDRLIARGIFHRTWVATPPTAYTDSGPGWATILTGVSPDKHRVRGNDFAGNALATYPDVLTLIERAKPELQTYAIASWPPLTGWSPEGAIVSDVIDVRVLRDGNVLGWAAADLQVTSDAIRYLESRDPDAAFVYLGNPDEVAHAHGVGDDYRAAIVVADGEVGLLLDTIEARPSYPEEDWLVIVTTDHGHLDQGGHGGASWQEKQSFVIAAGGEIRRNGGHASPRNVDIVATMLDHLGISVDPAWQLDGISLARPAAPAR